jgi:hypothetical protein
VRDPQALLLVTPRPVTGGLGCQRALRRSLKTYVVSVGWVDDSKCGGSHVRR